MEQRIYRVITLFTSGGDDSKATPYLISSKADMETLAGDQAFSDTPIQDALWVLLLFTGAYDVVIAKRQRQ